MPENLFFDLDDGCEITLLDARCEVTQTAEDFHDLGYGRVRTEIIISDWLQGEYLGGDLIKFTVSYGKNPTGARSAGGWGARTENLIGGEYYPIDADPSNESFYALSGSINT